MAVTGHRKNSPHAAPVTYGVNDQGFREVLGLEVALQEDGTTWTQFLTALGERGLVGVRLVISDAHLGLKEAIPKVFPGTVLMGRYPNSP